MMRVIERREWLEGGGGGDLDGERRRCAVVLEDPVTDTRYTLTDAPAAYASHALGMEVGLTFRAPDGER